MSKHRRDEDAGHAVPEEQKRRKKSRHEKLKYEDITPPSTNTTAGSTPVPEEVEDHASYTPSPNLTAVSPAEIESFYKDQSIRIEDPEDSGLRPIIEFSHLPVEISSRYHSVLSSFSKPSAIQSTAWPFLLSGRDVVGVAETGSGKTIAFGLPLVERLSKLKKKKGIRAVIVAPTRELAIQVYDQLEKLCQTAAGLKAACVYGGTNKDEQRRLLNGANVVVATPGRLKDFMSDGTIDVSKTRYVVLDEADRMLDTGFQDDIKHIVSHMPKTSKRQTAMFTATWPKSVRELAATFMSKPARITIGQINASDSGELRANTRIVQKVEVMDGAMKQQRLLQLLKEHNSGKKSNDRILVFCLYKKEASRIEGFIRSKGYRVASIHGDMSQSARIASLDSFKSGTNTLLVATDVAARGLDIPEVKVVINVTFPLTAEDYVHRIGRTGRAGKDGLAITFFTEQDKALSGGLIAVLKRANQPIPEDLMAFGTTSKKKQHDAYGAFFREDDGKKAVKVTFDD